MRAALTMAVFVGAVLGCSAPGGNAEPERVIVNTGNDGPASDAATRGPSDAEPSVDADAPPRPTRDADRADVDVRIRDVPPDADEPQPYFDEALWTAERPCPTDEPLDPVASGAFQMPNRPPAHDPVATRDEYEARIGSRGKVTTIAPAAALQPGAGIPYDLYANPGQDVTFHIYVMHDLEFYEIAGLRLNLVVMVDYLPTQARYVRWNGQRTQRFLDEVTTGISIEFGQFTQLIDVTIPAETFADGARMYEISVATNVTHPELARWGVSRRFALFYGGYDRPDRPCLLEPLQAPRTGIEEMVDRNHVGNAVAAIFTEDMPPELPAAGEMGDVESGTTQRIYVSKLPFATEPTASVSVPLLNGKPIAPAWWWTHGPASPGLIDGRGYFDATLEGAPYAQKEIMVVTWDDPYETFRYPDGTVDQNVSLGSGASSHSNFLRFSITSSQ